jgi:hypothetical protein
VLKRQLYQFSNLEFSYTAQGVKSSSVISFKSNKPRTLSFKLLMIVCKKTFFRTFFKLNWGRNCQRKEPEPLSKWIAKAQILDIMSIKYFY